MAELANRIDLENEFARKLARLNARHRKQLLAYLGNPPNTANVPDSFWQQVKQDVSAEIAALLLLVIGASSRQHGAFQSDAIAQRLSGGMAAESAESIVSTGRGRLQTASTRWSQTQQEGGIVTPQDVADTATSIFGPSRVEQISISEVSRGQEAGAAAGIEASLGGDGDALGGITGDGKLPPGAVIVRVWSHSQVRPAFHAGANYQPCPICTPLLDQPEEVWKARYPAGPPGHPRCDCYLRYRLVLPDGKTHELGTGGGTQ